MKDQFDAHWVFGKGASYPDCAGYTDHETSKDAADAIEGSGRAQTLRSKTKRLLIDQRNTCMWIDGHFEGEGMTADEIAEALEEPILSIRPRVAELHKQGLIEKTGERRKSSNGRMSHVWKLV